MNNNYNANLYLTPSDLNYIENTLNTLTEQVQSIVFNSTSSPLRNIQVGDNLSGKTIYLSFPRDSYQNITNSTKVNLITINNNTGISYIYNNNVRYIYIRYNNINHYIYAKKDIALNPYLNYVRVKLPYDFGIVTAVNTNQTLFQYIKIYDDEYIIPDYVKHTWTDNELLSMQRIDNIENGIKNIGYYYYKPDGFIGSKEWLGTAELGKSNNYCVGMKNISNQDLTRWTNNLNLINFDNINRLTIWNSSISEIDWNEENDTEWEEL